jgi:solute carrier family 1 (glial high affinity glutamate transporter), member 2
MLSLLKMLVLPLVAACMVSGMCSLRESGSENSMKRLAKLTAAFYILSTMVAIVLGLLLVSIIRPGRNAAFDKISTSSGGGCRGNDAALVAHHHAGIHTDSGEVESDDDVGDVNNGAAGAGATEALLHVARLIVPSNVVQAAVDTNVLGIITFSLLFGWALSSLGPQAAPVINAAHVINNAVGKMVTAALWISPIGVGCLIASSILRACDLGATISALGLWLATVILGLAIFAFIILPAFLFVTTGKSPLHVASYYGQALALAFGTSSSAAALPLAMAGAKEAGCDPAIIQFFLPLGIAINMNGTALYEATTALFIAQAHGVSLGPAEVVVVAATASLAAVGAPAIPSAGLVTMLIVLQAVGLDQFSGDLAVILAADWLLDRLRTAVNLLSDGFGCVAVDHLVKRGNKEEEEEDVGGMRSGHAYSHVEMGTLREDNS